MKIKQNFKLSRKVSFENPDRSVSLYTTSLIIDGKFDTTTYGIEIRIGSNMIYTHYGNDLFNAELNFRQIHEIYLKYWS